MTVLAYDPYISAERVEKIRGLSLFPGRLWDRADFITLHIPVS